jgi:hypothetical protein
MLEAVHRLGLPVDTALILGLTNGHIDYLTTAEEYAAQLYEGGSTLYGPGQAAMFVRAFSGLTTLLSSGDVLPPASARSISVFPGTRRALLHPEKSARPEAPQVERGWCSHDTLYVDYRLGSVQDWPAGSPFAASPNVEVLRDGLVEAWDDDPSVELHLRSVRQHPARWQLRWSHARAGSVYRLRLRGRLEGAPIAC